MSEMLKSETTHYMEEEEEEEDHEISWTLDTPSTRSTFTDIHLLAQSNCTQYHVTPRDTT